MKKELLFSGIGGQGIMNLGEILCAAAIRAGYNVTFSPVYGAEKRGGRTMCNIVISTEIECQVVSEADVMLIMDEASLWDYQHLAGVQGILILNAQVGSAPNCPCRNIQTVPFIEKAMELGSAKVANMIALGFVLKYLDFIPYASVEKLVEETFAGKAELIPLNLKALKTGYEYDT